MILADSNILIDASRPKQVAFAARVRSLSVVTAGIVLTEMIKGARTNAERTQAAAFWRTFPSLVFHEFLWEAMGDNLAALRRKGINVPFADVILATLAISYDVEVWSNDRHFPLMQIVLPDLKLFTDTV